MVCVLAVECSWASHVPYWELYHKEQLSFVTAPPTAGKWRSKTSHSDIGLITCKLITGFHEIVPILMDTFQLGVEFRYTSPLRINSYMWNIGPYHQPVACWQQTLFPRGEQLKFCSCFVTPSNGGVSVVNIQRLVRWWRMEMHCTWHAWFVTLWAGGPCSARVQASRGALRRAIKMLNTSHQQPGPVVAQAAEAVFERCMYFAWAAERQSRWGCPAGAWVVAFWRRLCKYTAVLCILIVQLTMHRKLGRERVYYFIFTAYKLCIRICIFWSVSKLRHYSCSI